MPVFLSHSADGILLCSLRKLIQTSENFQSFQMRGEMGHDHCVDKWLFLEESPPDNFKLSSLFLLISSLMEDVFLSSTNKLIISVLFLKVHLNR